MKILVIGGSYFFGRVFVMLAAKEHDVTVLNRGTCSVAELGAKQIKGDRKEEGVWKSIEDDYDCAVDFCAYEKGDIARVLENMPGRIRQYIFISTVDVYERGINGLKGEETPLETRPLPGEAGAYIAGKVALEREVREQCGKRDISCTVLRPAILYGPLNYAPRESVYIRLLARNRVLPRITDAAGSFQFVYVKDAAQAVLSCLLNPRAYGQAYNLCGEEVLTYDDFFRELGKASDVEAREIPLTAQEAESQGLPLPFPLTEAETELYSNEKSKEELGLRYMDIGEGMARTYRAFRDI
ncbi:NAD-dependent epimerase/dehydratase family protein [uncultured Acetatifactor sp.]|uniref:NAD-dependent epimerase/dehydratase family protein n=1 Tax=uncultured Acetatifactor sp. TaxID=1671927 RepID=UPI00261F5DFA|nr:NAD-dependent epimerase/dehydratase family protein [uncultured Acetatifactor sp.]